MPVAADLSRCIPFASAFCHRMALYKQVALFNTVRADKFPASAIPTRKLWWCDKARDFISFWKYSLYCCSSFTSYFVYYPPFASDNFSITVLATYRLPVWCSGFSIWNCEFHAVKLPVSIGETNGFMPWNYRFHGMKQNGITPWWVILFMTLPCSHCVPCLGFIIQLSKKQEITDIILISLLLGGCDIHLIAYISLLFSSFFSSSQLSGQNNGFSAN